MAGGSGFLMFLLKLFTLQLSGLSEPILMQFYTTTVCLIAVPLVFLKDVADIKHLSQFEGFDLIMMLSISALAVVYSWLVELPSFSKGLDGVKALFSSSDKIK